MLSRTAARLEDPLIGRFDRALFTGPMILIGADNQLAGQAGDHAAAAIAVAGGRGMTWAARVRPGVVAVDIDLSNESLAELVLEDVTGWCRRRGLWCATRASGGGAGRHHLVVVPERHQGELLDLIEQWRLQLKVSRQAIDVRSMIRPFAAPHRSGRACGLPGLAAGDLYRVQRAVRAAERHTPAVAACAPTPAPLRIAPTERFGPFRLAQAPVAAGDGSRSATEFVQTLRLVNRGAGIEQAWTLISAIEGGKAARRGRHWWECNVWSKVRPPAALKQHDLGALTLPVIAVSRPLYADLDTRQRHTLETVLVAILGRLHAREGRPAPVSERDLHLVTGLSRPAVRSAGRLAVKLGILSSSREQRQDAATVWKLGERAATASLIYPSILTPSPDRWLHSSPPGTATALLDHHLDPVPDSKPASTRQRQLHAAQSRALHRHGLLGKRRRPPAAQHGGLAGWHARLAAVTAERDAFYAGLRAARELRQAGYHRRILARRRRQQLWWQGLSTEQQQQRREVRREHLAQREPAQRQADVARLRDQRHLIQRLTRHYDHHPSQTTLPIPQGVPNAVPFEVQLTTI